MLSHLGHNMVEKEKISRKKEQLSQVIGVVVLFYTLVDMLFLSAIDHVSISLPVGIVFLIISRSNQIIKELGSKGLMIALYFLFFLLLALVIFYYLFL